MNFQKLIRKSTSNALFIPKITFIYVNKHYNQAKKRFWQFQSAFDKALLTTIKETTSKMIDMVLLPIDNHQEWL